MIDGKNNMRLIESINVLMVVGNHPPVHHGQGCESGAVGCDVKMLYTRLIGAVAQVASTVCQPGEKSVHFRLRVD